jgi:hypothetical protein
VRAWNVAIGSATPSAGCFRSGVVPPNSTIPGTTVEVLIWQTSTGTQFIALDELGTWQLGDAPTIRPPPAAEGLAWQRLESKPIGTSYLENRLTSQRFSFNDLSATTTQGTLTQRAQYSCTANTSACPTGDLRPFDAASCELTFSLNAQQVPLTAKWTTPVTPLVTGARRYLVAIDPMPVFTIATPSCFRNGQVPTGRSTYTETGSRAYAVWQTWTIGAQSFLRTDDGNWRLGDSPAIRLGADLLATGGTYVATTSTQNPQSSYVETRATRVSYPQLTTSEGMGPFELSSTYSCTGNCPTGNLAPFDAASCSASVGSVAVELP